MRVLVAEDDPLIALGLHGAPALARARADRARRRTGRRRSSWRTRASPTSTCSTSRCRTLDGLQAATQLADDGPAASGRRRHRRRRSEPDRALDRKRRQRLPDQAGRHTRAARRRSSWPPRGMPSFEALEAEVDRAQQALEDRKLVERAKGLLMSALDLSEQDAFRRLQLTARERNLRLADVAGRGSSSSRACSSPRASSALLRSPCRQRTRPIARRPERSCYVAAEQRSR